MPDRQPTFDRRDLCFRRFGDGSGANISVVPGSWNPTDRSIEIAASMGADVVRMDWRTGEKYIERIAMGDSNWDLSRFNSGIAPIIDAHDIYDNCSVRGIIPADTARIEGGVLYHRAVMSDAGVIADSKSDAYFTSKVAAGILRAVSVGYLPMKVEIDDSGEMQVRTITLIQPYETSFVPVGADPDASSRGLAQPPQIGNNRQVSEPGHPAIPAPKAPTLQRSAMTPEEIAAQNEANQRAINAAVETATKAAVAEHKARNAAVAVTIRALGLDAETPEVRAFVDGDQPIDDVRAALIDMRAAKADKTPTASAHRGASYGESDVETRYKGMEEALTRSWLPNVATAATENGNRYMQRGVQRLFQDCLEMAGHDTRNMSTRDIWERTIATAHQRSVSQMGTNDFIGLLSNLDGKTLRAAYAAEKRPWLPLVRRVPVQNFKPQSSLQISAGSEFQEVAEGAEYTLGTVTESKETWRLLKYGGIDCFTWEMFLADDLGAFLRFRAGKAAVAARKENALFYSMFNANTGAGQTMADGFAMCSTQHSNLVSGVGNVGAPTVTTIGAVRTKFAGLTGLDGEPLEADMAYLLYPYQLDTAVDKVLSRKLMAAKADDITPDYINDLKPIRAKRLTSATGWYGIADPADVECFVQGYLAGYEGLQSESRQSFNVDGWEFKAKMQTAFHCVDPRGVVFNPGA